MKKNFYKIGIFLLIAALLFGGTVFADKPAVNDPSASRVYDDFLGLTAEEEDLINQRITEFSAEHGVDLAFVFTNDYINDFAEGDTSVTLYDFLDIFYEAYGYGAGAENSGVIIGFDETNLVYDFEYFGSPSEENWEKTIDALDVVISNFLLKYVDYEEAFDGIMSSIELIDAAFDNISKSGAQDHRVFDFAELLGDSEAADLEARIAKFRSDYKMDVVLLFADKVYFSENRLNDGSSGTFRQFVEDFYDYFEFGYDGTYDGIILALSMEGGPGNRDYCLLTSGDAQNKLPDSVLDYIENSVTDCLADEDFSGAANAFVDSAESVLDGSYEKSKKWEDLLISLGVSAAIALVITAVTAFSQMNVARKFSASGYIVDGSVNITESSDYYMNTTVTRTKIKSESSGGGGSSIGSSGRSHGGRSGKF